MPSADELSAAAASRLHTVMGDSDGYIRVGLEQADNTSMLWRPREPRDREDHEGGKYVIHVSNWLLKGHGVPLTWWPRDRIGRYRVL